MSRYFIADIMSRKPVSIQQSASLQDAALLMREKNVGSLIVRDANEREKILGVLTEWDFVHRAAAKGADMSTSTVNDFAVTDIITVTPAMDLFEALRLMRDADINHLPVMDEDKLVGLVTMKDILKIQPQLIEILTEQHLLGDEEF